MLKALIQQIEDYIAFRKEIRALNVIRKAKEKEIECIERSRKKELMLKIHKCEAVHGKHAGVYYMSDRDRESRYWQCKFNRYTLICRYCNIAIVPGKKTLPSYQKCRCLACQETAYGGGYEYENLVYVGKHPDETA